MAGGDGNLLAALPQRLEAEQTTELVATENLRIERIVSSGQASPPGFSYDQPRAEWVLLVAGSAGLLFEGEAEPRVLNAGDYLLIPAHRRHRVAWTDVEHPTVWLTVHFC
ncbi:MAG: cupin domain-containing protein [Hyphomicrobiales bacterium]|nr:cupin domain-containing protein [Hyphomicrobiales bacterium]